MEIEYLDERTYEQRKVYVPEHILGLKGAITTLQNKNTIGKKVREQLMANNYRLTEAIKCDIWNERVCFFSKKAGEVLNKILGGAKLESLTNTELLILTFDAIFPTVYEENELHNDSFIYQWFISSCKFIWHAFDDKLKTRVWHLIYPNKEYVEKDLSEGEALALELQDYPGIQQYLIPMGDPKLVLSKLLQYKDHLRPRLWGYCIRNFYLCDTLGIPTKMLHDAFDGLTREDLMFKDELIEFEKLPEYITIFRGTDFEETIPRLSWSLDRSCANKFNQGKLLSAKIPKEQALAYFVDCESEILAWVDPSQLI